MITVRRQILDVDVFGEESDGVLLHHRLPAVCADVVSPALEAGFAGVDLSGERLCIDRIVIELQHVDIDRLEAELADAVRRGVGEYLRDHPLGVGAEAMHRAAPDEARRSTAREAIDDALVAFLRTGRLPWSFRVPPGEQFEEVVQRAWSGGAGPSPSLRRRFADAFAMPSARSRLVLQFTPQFAVALLRELSPHVASVGGEVLAVLGADSIPAPTRRRFALKVWDAALVAAANDRRPSAADLVRRAVAEVELTAAEAGRLAEVYEGLSPEAAALLREIEKTAGPPDGLVRGRGGAALPQPRDETNAAETPQAGEHRGESGLGEETEGILVEEAGLVLLHPYLPRFLDGLGAADGDELRDPHRAVCLLHLLATGEITAPEHRVTLAKALCGIPLDEPVPADCDLDDAEVEEATALLSAVVEHWGSLGGASPDGLREGFLQRDGVLSIDAWGDWLLRIERRSIDILLDDLPWSVSIVALPWMERRLIVEWR